MDSHRINIYSNDKIIVDKKIKKAVRNCVMAVLHKEAIFDRAEVDISFVSNKTIRQYNRIYRNKDAVTDVLSFPVLEFDGQYKPILLKGDTDLDTETVLLGDVVISLQRAASQSREYGHSFLREVCFLTVHSMYHLFGYDHEDDEERKIMRRKEELILSSLGIIREGENNEPS